jgi:hypothetical protein
MAQVQFTNLTAMAAVGLARVVLTTAGPGRLKSLKELAEAAVFLAQQISKGGADRIPNGKRGAVTVGAGSRHGGRLRPL